MFWLGLVVFVVTFALSIYATFSARRRRAGEGPPIRGDHLVIWGGVIIPIPILGLVLGYTIYSGNITAAPIVASGPEPSSHITVDLIGFQFWWEVRYLAQEVTTANEIHIPVGEPVLFRVTSADVIHSFWVPQLHGKIDLIPGQTNEIWLQADEPGIYRGLCAEFCGQQHAFMHLLVVAQPRGEFNAWIEHQRLPAIDPQDELARQGQQVFMGAACVYCHNVRGLNQEAATPSEGPDLTHVASRMTLAAGMIENNRGNLGGWISDPQGIKPGNKMPPTRMSSEHFIALLAYLEGLR
jgi:cytochrome c oxidase subunit II